MTIPLYTYKVARHLVRAKDALLKTDDAALEEAINATTSALAALFDEKNRRGPQKPDAIEQLLGDPLPHYCKRHRWLDADGQHPCPECVFP